MRKQLEGAIEREQKQFDRLHLCATSSIRDTLSRDSAVQAEAKGLTEDESQRKERRKVDKFITLQVQQISATQQQVLSYPRRRCSPKVLPGVRRCSVYWECIESQPFSAPPSGLTDAEQPV